MLPADGFLESLTHLITNRSAFVTFAKSLQDSRQTEQRWSASLHKELLLLNEWCLRRILYAARHIRGKPKDQIPVAPGRVLCLLPRWGPAIHVIRRGVPFAALQIPTDCGFPPEIAKQASAVVNRIARVFGIEQWINPIRTSPRKAVASATRKHLVVITGRRRSIEAVARRTIAPCLGCGGRCAVVLGHSKIEVTSLLRRLRKHQLASSCTRPRVGLVLSRLKGNYELAEGLGERPWIGELRHALEKLHPSVVLQISGGKQRVRIETVYGYRLMTCSRRGTVDDAMGFAADPIYGWPGDYRF